MADMIVRKTQESIDIALRRFKRKHDKTGLLNEVRHRDFFEKPTMRRKRKLNQSRPAKRRNAS